jgi:hypothetical protein
MPDERFATIDEGVTAELRLLLDRRDVTVLEVRSLREAEVTEDDLGPLLDVADED